MIRATNNTDRYPVLEEYRSACEAWPTLAWGYDAFSRRFQRSIDALSQRSLHSADLYLAGAAADGVPEAWRLIETEYGPRVIRSMQRRRRISEEAAEDIWCETRTRLMEPVQIDDTSRTFARIGHYKGNTPLLSYMLAAVSNRMNDRIRREKVRQTQAMPDFAGGLADERRVAPSVDAVEAETRQTLRDILTRAFTKLTPRQRSVLQMVFGVSEANQKDVAEQLKTSPATVSREIQRAIGALRHALASAGTMLDIAGAMGAGLSDVLSDCLCNCNVTTPVSAPVPATVSTSAPEPMRLAS